jgi:hypothetical protein
VRDLTSFSPDVRVRHNPTWLIVGSGPVGHPRSTTMNRRTLVTRTAAVAFAGAAAPLLSASPTHALQEPGQSDGRRRPDGQRHEDRNLAVMRKYVDNLTSGNGAANAMFKSPSMTVTAPAALPYGGTTPDAVYGPALGQYFRPSDTPAAIEPTLYADGDKVFLSGSFAAVALATGTAFDVPLLEVFTLADALITNDTIYYFDLDVLLTALAVDL